MVNETTPGLKRFYEFFEKTGKERLDGLDSSYFAGLTEVEKKEAWEYLKDRFFLSEERVKGLYLLDSVAAVALFKEAMGQPAEGSAYAAVRQGIENCRVMMQKFICAECPTRENINLLASLVGSEFPRVRASVVQALPTSQTTPEAIAAIKSVIFTETERIPLASAITKFMAIYGFDFDAQDETYKSIYLGLRGDSIDDKKRSIAALEANGAPILI